VAQEATTVRDLTQQCLARLAGIEAAAGEQAYLLHATQFSDTLLLAQANYLLKDYGATEAAVREAIKVRALQLESNSLDQRDDAQANTYLAMALARQRRFGEALAVVRPVVEFHRGLAKRNIDDQLQHVELASALYAQALADKPQRAALLGEARKLIGGVPPSVQQLKTVALWRDRIAAETGRAE
jgi:hypothetical protein